MYATDLLSEHLYGGHHGGNVDTSSEGVQGDVLLFTSSSHPLTHFLQTLQANQDTVILRQKQHLNREKEKKSLRFSAIIMGAF